MTTPTDPVQMALDALKRIRHHTPTYGYFGQENPQSSDDFLAVEDAITALRARDGWRPIDHATLKYLVPAWWKWRDDIDREPLYGYCTGQMVETCDAEGTPHSWTDLDKFTHWSPALPPPPTDAGV